MNYAQYCRIESRAGGVGASRRAILRAARKMLNQNGKSRAMRTARHEWLREVLAEHAESVNMWRTVLQPTYV